MKKSYVGHLPLVIGMSVILVSCDRKEEAKSETQGAISSTAELAREARFSPWTSKAGLQLKLEGLPDYEYFSMVEGRLKDGANQYRAITDTFDNETYHQWDTFWGVTEEELFDREIALLRGGFDRHNTQVFTDSSGVALHQLVMLQKVGAEISLSALSNVTSSVNENRLDSQPVPSPSVVEVEQSDVPDFIKPELRTIDDDVDSIPNLDPVVEEGIATSLAEVSGEPKPSEVMEVTPDSPKPVDPPVVEVAEDPELKPEPKIESKPEVKVEKPEPKPEPKIVKYKVIKGDTLSGIARRYKVRVSDIKRVNGLRSDIIRLSQVLKIPKQ